MKSLRISLSFFLLATSAFTVFGSDSYRKDADDKSWKRLGEYLQETLR